MQTTITSKGQVTIPRDLRQFLGIKPGMAVTFEIEGDHIALRAAPALPQGASGYGLIQSRRSAVPPDFDVASVISDAP